MRSEISGPKLKLDPYFLLPFPGVPERETVRVGCLYFVDTKLQTSGNLRKEKNNTEFILGSVPERRIL